jgi:hypothetical protein
MGVVAVDAFAFMIVSLPARVVVFLFLPINPLLKPLVSPRVLLLLRRLDKIFVAFLVVLVHFSSTYQFACSLLIVRAIRTIILELVILESN